LGRHRRRNHRSIPAVVRSWIGGEDGGYDMTKIVEHSRVIIGLTGMSSVRSCWPASLQLRVTTPSRQPAELSGCPSCCGGGVCPRTTADTFGEAGMGTPVHAWSATPTKDLVGYVLGVTPANRYGTVRVAGRAPSNA
jgi:hypothetical protein